MNQRPHRWRRLAVWGVSGLALALVASPAFAQCGEHLAPSSHAKPDEPRTNPGGGLITWKVKRKADGTEQIDPGPALSERPEQAPPPYVPPPLNSSPPPAADPSLGEPSVAIETRPSELRPEMPSAPNTIPFKTDKEDFGVWDSWPAAILTLGVSVLVIGGVRRYRRKLRDDAAEAARQPISADGSGSPM